MVSNFRTYEAQSRLLAAVIASHPGLKLNFKAITLHFGSDVTESVIRHRFRPVKMQAEAVRQAVAQGRDARELSGIFHVNEKDIAKYFGESTPQGVEFQFRGIRKDAKALRDAVDKGESPLTVRKSVPASGGGRKPSAGTSLKRRTPPATGADAAAHPTKRTGGTAATATASKRPRTDLVLSNSEDGSSSSLAADDVDYEQLDLTPMGTPTPTSRLLPAARPPSSSPAPPMTPTAASAAAAAAAVVSAASSFVPDLTPALTAGSSPSAADTPVADLKYISGVRPLQQRHQPGGRFYARASAVGVNRRDVFSVGDDDDDDDDAGVYLIDTPSKVPKTEAAAASAAAVIASTSDFGSWQSFTHAGSQNQSQSQSQSHPTDSSQLFDGGSSSWALEDPFSSGTSQAFSQSFSHSTSQSFYESEGAI